MPLNLSAVPIVDHHAHNLMRPEHVDLASYVWAFTEGRQPDAMWEQGQTTLFFRRSMRDVGALLGVEPTLEAVWAARQHLGFEEMARRFLSASGLKMLLLDDGLTPDRVLPLDWHTRFAPVRRVLRVEHLAETLAQSSTGFADFEARFLAALDEAATSVAAYKTVVAYRTGLQIDPPDRNGAAAGLTELKRQAVAGERVRLACKPLNDWVVLKTLEAASRSGLPVQIHTGFGNPDLDLRLANPLHLRPILENPSFAHTPLVLLHAAYPFQRAAGFLTGVYPNAWLDLGVAIPLLSVAGMRAVVREALEFAPLNKIMFSTDARVIPELYYLGARWGRRVLADELDLAVTQGDLNASEAEAAAEAILGGNAQRLYRLGI